MIAVSSHWVPRGRLVTILVAILVTILVAILVTILYQMSFLDKNVLLLPFKMDHFQGQDTLQVDTFTELKACILVIECYQKCIKFISDVTLYFRLLLPYKMCWAVSWLVFYKKKIMLWLLVEQWCPPFKGITHYNFIIIIIIIIIHATYHYVT